MPTASTHSPLMWGEGKYYSASCILAAFKGAAKADMFRLKAMELLLNYPAQRMTCADGKPVAILGETDQ